MSPIKDFRKAIELNPKNADAWLWLGVALRRSNQPAEAQKAFDAIASKSIRTAFGPSSSSRKHLVPNSFLTETIARLDSLTSRELSSMPGTLQDFAQAVHNVISICRDAEQGFRGAAQAANEPTMKEMFQQYSAQRAQFAVELQGAVKALGFEATDPQGLGGMMHASWISLKSMVTGHDVHGILVETERAEDWSLKTYRVALGHDAAA